MDDAAECYHLVLTARQELNNTVVLFVKVTTGFRVYVAIHTNAGLTGSTLRFCSSIGFNRDALPCWRNAAKNIFQSAWQLLCDFTPSSVLFDLVVTTHSEKLNHRWELH